MKRAGDRFGKLRADLRYVKIAASTALTRHRGCVPDVKHTKTINFERCHHRTSKMEHAIAILILLVGAYATYKILLIIFLMPK